MTNWTLCKQLENRKENTFVHFGRLSLCLFVFKWMSQKWNLCSFSLETQATSPSTMHSTCVHVVKMQPGKLCLLFQPVSTLCLRYNCLECQNPASCNESQPGNLPFAKSTANCSNAAKADAFRC